LTRIKSPQLPDAVIQVKFFLVVILEGGRGPLAPQDRHHFLEAEPQALAQRGDKLADRRVHHVAESSCRARAAPYAPDVAEQVFLPALLMRIDGRNDQLQRFENRRAVALGPSS